MSDSSPFRVFMGYADTKRNTLIAFGGQIGAFGRVEKREGSLGLRFFLILGDRLLNRQDYHLLRSTLVGRQTLARSGAPPSHEYYLLAVGTWAYSKKPCRPILQAARPMPNDCSAHTLRQYSQTKADTDEGLSGFVNGCYWPPHPIRGLVGRIRP